MCDIYLTARLALHSISPNPVVYCFFFLFSNHTKVVNRLKTIIRYFKGNKVTYKKTCVIFLRVKKSSTCCVTLLFYFPNISQTKTFSKYNLCFYRKDHSTAGAAMESQLTTTLE